jgi:hypothetical protein
MTMARAIHSIGIVTEQKIFNDNYRYSKDLLFLISLNTNLDLMSSLLFILVALGASLKEAGDIVVDQIVLIIAVIGIASSN